MTTVIRYCVIWCYVVLIGAVHSINIDFDDSKDGFFLKSTYHKFKPSEPNIVKESLILTHPAEVYKLRASYGPFEMYQSVPNNVLSSVLQYGEDVWDKSTSKMHRQVIHNMDVSAHLVGSRAVWRSNPAVQLLIHATPLVRRQKQRLIYSYYGVIQRWCARLVVSKGDEKYTSACVLGKDNACVVGMHLPDHWWDAKDQSAQNSSSTGWFSTGGSSSSIPTYSAQQHDEVLVFYDLSGVRDNQECASVANTLKPATNPLSTSEKFITAVHLVHDHLVTSVERNARDLLFKVPVADFAPGVKFEVPVFLGKSSSHDHFIVQVNVEGNVAIEGASTNIHSPWNVIFEAGDTDGSAIVSVMIKDKYKVEEINRSEEVMRWQFRVLLNSDSTVATKVTWSVDSDRDHLPRQPDLVSDLSKFTVKLNIVSMKNRQVVPVIKERSLLNTAVLSGKQVIHELVIFHVGQDNSYGDITRDCYCRSLDPEVVKVTLLCDQVYLDGSETRGSQNVTIVVHAGKEVEQFSLRVWVPEPRLDVQVSDVKLSQVRRWKVEDKATYRRNAGLSNKTSLNNQPSSCSLKYQQAQLEVYARFTISTPGLGTQYFRSKKTLVRVTSLVLNRTRIANPTVAKIYGQTVQGVAPGRTQVQVISPTGKLIGYREIRVAKDKVDIERLMVRVISGMGLHIEQMEHLPGALLATVYLQDQLVARQQEAVLDIALEFKDGTMLPLSMVDPKEYDLRVMSVNENIVEVTESISSAPGLPPSIKAVGDGKGEIIKVTLKEKGLCDRKKSRTLDTEYVHVQVDFAKDLDFYNRVQSDGYYFSGREQTKNSQPQHHYTNKEEYLKHQKLRQQQDNIHGRVNAKMPALSNKDYPSDYKSETATPTNSEEEAEMTGEPKTEALEQPVNTKAKHPTPLEIAMYVLVAVFVFAILVFTANCAVFMMRHQRKYKPHGASLTLYSGTGQASSKVSAGSISQAPDWVWIGRATLERQGGGSTNTGLATQPLMAEEDFNGNQMVVPNNSATSGIGSSSVSSTASATSSRGARPASSSNRKSGIAMSRSSSSGGCPATSASSGCHSNRNSMVSTYQGSECSIRITSNPLPEAEPLSVEEPAEEEEDLGGMGYNEAEWDYEAMGMTYEQLMDYFDNLKESSA